MLTRELPYAVALLATDFQATSERISRTPSDRDRHRLPLPRELESRGPSLNLRHERFDRPALSGSLEDKRYRY